MKENYERASLNVIEFEQEDVIVTSAMRVVSFRRDEYEGHVMSGDR